MFLSNNSTGNALSFVDLRTGKEIGPLGHNMALQSVQFSADGKEVVTQSSDSTTYRWDAASGQNLGLIKAMSDGKPNIKPVVSPDGLLLAKVPGTLKAGILVLADAASAGNDAFLLISPGPCRFGFRRATKCLPSATARWATIQREAKGSSFMTWPPANPCTLAGCHKAKEI